MKQNHIIKVSVLKWILPLTLLVFMFAGAQMAFADEAISIEENEYTIELGDYKYISIYSGEADESTWNSSDENVVVIREVYSYGVYLEAVGPGNSVISVSDAEGHTASCTVTVTIPEWELSQTSFEDVVSNYSGEVEIDTSYWDFDFTATSSNTKVVKAEAGSSYVYLDYVGVGSAVVTITDKFERSATLNVTLTSPPLQFEEDIQTEYSEYEYNDTFYIYTASEWNKFTSARSSDTGVLKVKVENEDSWSCIVVTPVGAGSATITAIDQYNQTCSIDITISQKFIDEMKYLDLFAYSFFDMSYGDTVAYFGADSSDFKGATITAIIGGKSYTAVYNGYSYGTYEYVIRNIPVLPVGTEIKYTITKGEATYSGTSEIMAGDVYYNGWLELSGYTYTYSGKSITPAVYLEYSYNNSENYSYLRRGTDFNVTYSNNLDVGTATATATGIGNYRASISERYTIVPKGTSISKLKKAKKSFTVKWNKQAAKMSKTPITGYQIRCSLKSSMSGAKTVTVKGYAKTSTKVKKLKAKKKYYVQIRTYKTVNGKNYYSSWSAKKTVKTK